MDFVFQRYIKSKKITKYKNISNKDISIVSDNVIHRILKQYFVYRINFLKYQPPPKNLEHLQNSAVYRLVHDMEPALKGIGTRDTKILAEQDYYSEVSYRI